MYVKRECLLVSLRPSRSPRMYCIFPFEASSIRLHNHRRDGRDKTTRRRESEVTGHRLSQST
jgi:hypothetical protein